MEQKSDYSERIVLIGLCVILFAGALFLNEKDSLQVERPDLMKIKEFLDERKIVNINSATPGELTDLPGIGNVMAQRIVKYRNENGSFSFADDLLKIKGIGPKKLEKMKSYINVGVASR